MWNRKQKFGGKVTEKMTFNGVLWIVKQGMAVISSSVFYNILGKIETKITF